MNINDQKFYPANIRIILSHSCTDTVPNQVPTVNDRMLQQQENLLGTYLRITSVSWKSIIIRNSPDPGLTNSKWN